MHWKCQLDSSSLQVMCIEVGNYTLNISAANVVSNISYNATIIVQNMIVGLVLNGTVSVVSPPGQTVYKLTSPASPASPVTDVTCNWQFTNGFSTTTFVPVLDSAHPHTLSHVYSYMDDGVVGVSVNCSNLVSSAYLNTSTVVIADAVLMSSLYCNTSMLRNNTLITLTLKRLGVISCLIFNLGDGTTKAYATNITACNLMMSNTYELITTSTLQISVIHRYSMSGIFMVSVYGFSVVNNMTKSSPAVVLPLPCTPPIAQLPSNFTSTYVNYLSVGFSIVPNITLNCSMPWPLFSLWQVYDSTGQLVIEQENTTFIYNARSSPVW
jgi:hypothetical protein